MNTVALSKHGSVCLSILISRTAAGTQPVVWVWHQKAIKTNKMWRLQIQNVFFPQTPVKEPNSENVDISTGGGVTGWKTKCCSWTDTHSYSHTHTHTHTICSSISLSLSLSLSLIPHFCLTLFRSVLLTGFSVINTSLMFLTLTTACWHLYFWKKPCKEKIISCFLLF